jgi:hypothetical protein
LDDWLVLAIPATDEYDRNGRPEFITNACFCSQLLIARSRASSSNQFPVSIACVFSSSSRAWCPQTSHVPIYPLPSHSRWRRLALGRVTSSSPIIRFLGTPSALHHIIRTAVSPPNRPSHPRRHQTKTHSKPIDWIFSLPDSLLFAFLLSRFSHLRPQFVASVGTGEFVRKEKRV